MRHGVEMTGQHHPLFSPELGPGDERVAVPGHRQLRQASELALDRVRERALLAADGGDVGQRGGQLGAVEVQVEVVVHGRQRYRGPGLAAPAASPAACLVIAWAAPRSALTITATDGRPTDAVRATANTSLDRS